MVDVICLDLASFWCLTVFANGPEAFVRSLQPLAMVYLSVMGVYACLPLLLLHHSSQVGHVLVEQKYSDTPAASGLTGNLVL